jgi:hypothetical protein
MPIPGRTHCFILALAAAAAMLPGFADAQARPAAQAPAAQQAAPPTTDRDAEATQEQLIKLLRLSPTLTTVVEHDSSLLANQDYVNRTNPQLGQFLASHPEVVRSPDFYLFNNLGGDGSRDQALERKVWPETQRPWDHPSTMDRFMDDAIPFLVFLGILGAVLWLVTQFLENRRWSRIFKLQNDVHSKLIDKFGSNQELLTYMDTEAGKRFLEAAPIPVGFEAEQRVPNAVARVLTPLQIGVVLSLLGIGMLALRNSLGTEMHSPMLLMGTVVLMPGLGFIISAGLTWVLAAKLGLMPDHDGAPRFDSTGSISSKDQR